MRNSILITVILCLLVSACSTAAPAPTVTPLATPASPAPTATLHAALDASPTSPPTPLPQAVVSSAALPLYAGPDNLLFPILATLQPRDRIDLIGVYGDFAKIRANVSGKVQEGYVYAGQLDALPASLPVLREKDAPSIVVDALAWQGWDFEYQGMRAALGSGGITSSSIDGYLTWYNQANPLKLSRPLAVRFKATGSGKQAEISIAGKFAQTGVEWYQGIRCLSVMVLNSSAGQQLAVTYNEGKNDGATRQWIMNALPAGGEVLLTFADRAGTQFTLSDGQGNPLTLDGQPGSLPSPLFPDGVAYLGFSVPPASGIEITEYQVILPASGKFTSPAELTQAAPTTTPEPKVDLEDIKTWPGSMQTYFSRAPGEWNNPTKQYGSDAAFHIFIQKTRREFLTAHGVAGVEAMNEQAVFTEYLRYGVEHKQILTLTPIELRNMVADPNNEGVTYKHIANGKATSTEGIFALWNFQDNDASYPIVRDRFLNKTFTVPMFGLQTEVARYNYWGVMGDEIGLFNLPGINPNEGIGVLVHYINDAEKHCYMPIATHFNKQTVLKGDLVFRGGGAGVVPSPVESVMEGAHTYIRGHAYMKSIPLTELVNNLGLKITVYPDSELKGEFEQSFPWQFGLEGGQRFAFTEAQYLPPFIPPWSP